MRNYLIFTMLALALLASCSRSSIQKGALTRVIVERRSLPTDDTILARLGGAEGTGAQQGPEQGSDQGSDEGSASGVTTGSESDPTTATASDEGSPSAGAESPEQGSDKESSDGATEATDNGSTAGSKKPATPATPTAELLYHVIVASFPLERADVVEGEVAKLRATGVDARIIKSDGRARLAYASFATKAEATAARDSLVRTTPKYRDAWVLRAKL